MTNYSKKVFLRKVLDHISPIFFHIRISEIQSSKIKLTIVIMLPFKIPVKFKIVTNIIIDILPKFSLSSKSYYFAFIFPAKHIIHGAIKVPKGSYGVKILNLFLYLQVVIYTNRNCRSAAI